MLSLEVKTVTCIPLETIAHLMEFGLRDGRKAAFCMWQAQAHHAMRHT